ncbi:MAG: RNase adapter RapZ [Rhodospirillales bacterium]|nr:RNase adapter RapZ [Rhodospirillales bacterium]
MIVPLPVTTPHAAAARRRIALVTGLSGAGRSTAMRALEDAGYEAVDNLPLTLLASLVLSDPDPAHDRPVAIGVDTRTRDFGVDALVAAIDRLKGEQGLDVRLLYLDCDDETLSRRFTETRRRHPLAADRPLVDGIKAERRLLEPLRARADRVVDTSALAPHQLKRIVLEDFSLDAPAGLALSVVSFAYRNGLPREADLVFDVRFLSNPHYRTDLKPLTGRDAEVARFVERDPGFQAFFDGLSDMILALLPRFEAEGKSYLTVAVGCTGGRHRSVFVAERLADRLAKGGRRVNLVHRDLDRGFA